MKCRRILKCFTFYINLVQTSMLSLLCRSPYVHLDSYISLVPMSAYLSLLCLVTEWLIACTPICSTCLSSLHYPNIWAILSNRTHGMPWHYSLATQNQQHLSFHFKQALFQWMRHYWAVSMSKVEKDRQTDRQTDRRILSICNTTSLIFGGNADTRIIGGNSWVFIKV